MIQRDYSDTVFACCIRQQHFDVSLIGAFIELVCFRIYVIVSLCRMSHKTLSFVANKRIERHEQGKIVISSLLFSPLFLCVRIRSLCSCYVLRLVFALSCRSFAIPLLCDPSLTVLPPTPGTNTAGRAVVSS